MSDPILDVRNLNVHFETRDDVAEVLKGIDLRIEEGESAALVGETGCGKSVTTKAIMGLLKQPPALIPSGEVRYKGTDVLDLSPADRTALRGSEMSMIMQHPMSALNPVFTIEEQMVDVMKWQGQQSVSVLDWLRDKFKDHSDLRARAAEMLEQVQIPAPDRVLSSYPSELSGGMRQRVLIATALLSEPDLLIADEPGTALDVTTEAKVHQLLESAIAETDTSMLYITHDLGVAKKISDRIYVMYAGEIVEAASTETLFEQPMHPYTRGLLDSIPQLSRGMGFGIEGQLPDYTNPPPNCQFAPRCPFAEPECTDVYPYRRDVATDQSVACHFYDGPATLERNRDLEAETSVDIGEPPWDKPSEQSSDQEHERQSQS